LLGAEPCDDLHRDMVGADLRLWEGRIRLEFLDSQGSATFWISWICRELRDRSPMHLQYPQLQQLSALLKQLKKPCEVCYVSLVLCYTRVSAMIGAPLGNQTLPFNQRGKPLPSMENGTSLRDTGCTCQSRAKVGSPRVEQALYCYLFSGNALVEILIVPLTNVSCFVCAALMTSQTLQRKLLRMTTWLRRRRLQQTGGRRIAEIGITGRWRGDSIASGRIWNDSEEAWRAPHEVRDVIETHCLACWHH
jgi:hypothetical protein